jgi:hypothetical protein
MRRVTWIYFVLVFVPMRQGQWGKVSDVYESDTLITVSNFSEMREKIEGLFKSLYPQSDGVNLEDYKLIGARANLDSEEDADQLEAIVQHLGFRTDRVGTQVNVSL